MKCCRLQVLEALKEAHLLVCIQCDLAVMCSESGGKESRMYVCNGRIDVDAPAGQWVLAVLGILWALHRLSGQTYPAVLLVQPHHRCPVGG